MRVCGLNHNLVFPLKKLGEDELLLSFSCFSGGNFFNSFVVHIYSRHLYVAFQYNKLHIISVCFYLLYYKQVERGQEIDTAIDTHVFHSTILMLQISTQMTRAKLWEQWLKRLSINLSIVRLFVLNGKSQRLRSEMKPATLEIFAVNNNLRLHFCTLSPVWKS